MHTQHIIIINSFYCDTSARAARRRRTGVCGRVACPPVTDGSTLDRTGASGGGGRRIVARARPTSLCAAAATEREREQVAAADQDGTGLPAHERCGGVISTTGTRGAPQMPRFDER